MAKLSPEARGVLDEFVAGRTPDAARRRRNLDATLARLGEDPLADTHVVARRRVGWVVGLAAAIVITTLGAVALRGTIASRTDVPTPTQAASAPESTAVHDARTRPEAPARSTAPPPAQLPEADTPAPESTPTPTLQPTPRPRVRTPTSPPPAATNVAEQLALETALLSRVRDAVDAGDDATALAELRRHAREFPRGAMIEDRRALLAIVACRSGGADAATDAAAFLRAHARSPYAAAVRRACASVLPP